MTADPKQPAKRSESEEFDLKQLAQRPEGEDVDLDKQLQELALELGKLQRAAREATVPVILLVEGWEAAGKGTLLNRLALALDPRGYRVLTVQSATEHELHRPPLFRFWRDLPEPGRIVLYDRSWYDRVWRGLADGEHDRAALSNACKDIRAFERTLTDHGVVIVKLFLHISRRKQAHRFRKLLGNRATAWRIDSLDLRQHRRYRRWRKAIETVMAETSSEGKPFLVIDAQSRRGTAVVALRELGRAIRARVETLAPDVPPIVEGAASAPVAERITSGPSRLDGVDLNQQLDQQAYVLRLNELKARLGDLEGRIHAKQIGVVILYEGWDAAGKGGSIRRLVSGLDPRRYEVIPIGAPTSLEKSMHYLWRFALRLPRAGHIAIYDRSWYGRVLVERVEGFCSEADWRRAYDEIRLFERHLVRSGNVLIKFWLHIDPEEQLRRFQAREAAPDKQWKITAEDWRNREKRPAYEAAVADMLELTSTARSRWTIVPSNNKLYSRVYAMRTVADAIARHLEG